MQIATIVLVTKTEKQKPEVRTVQQCLLAGVLCHKPVVQRLFTFDAFRFSPQARAQRGKALNNERIRHAQPRTEGYGFSRASALKLTDVDIGGRKPEEYGPATLASKPCSGFGYR